MPTSPPHPKQFAEISRKTLDFPEGQSRLLYILKDRDTPVASGSHLYNVPVLLDLANHHFPNHMLFRNVSTTFGEGCCS